MARLRLASIKREFDKLSQGQPCNWNTILTAVKFLTDTELKSACGVINSPGKTGLTIAEQALYQACWYNNKASFQQLYTEITTKGITIDSAMLKNISDTSPNPLWMNDQLECWKNEELVTTKPEEAIKSEFQRLNAGAYLCTQTGWINRMINPYTIFTAVKGLKDSELKSACGVINSPGKTGLTIAEQALYQACWYNDKASFQQLYTEITTKGITIDSAMLKNISDTSPHPLWMNDQLECWKNEELVKTKPEEAIKSEFQRLNAGAYLCTQTGWINRMINPYTIFTAVKGLKDSELKSACGVINSPGKTGLTIAEQALYQACRYNNKALFQHLYTEITTKGITIDSVMLNNISDTSPNPMGMNDQLECWKNEELVKTKPEEAIKSEFQRLNAGAYLCPYTRRLIDRMINPDTILAAVTNPLIKLTDDCGLLNGLSIGEQTIAQAFISSKSTTPLSPLQWKSMLDKVGSSLTDVQIKNIADFLKKSLIASSDDVKTWIYQERIKNELEKGRASQPINTAVIINALSQGKDIWSNLYYVNSPFTIADQAVAQAYKSKDPLILTAVYDALNKEGMIIDSQKIANSFSSNQDQVSDWINQELISISPQQAIINEFQREKPNPTTITNALDAIKKLGISNSKVQETAATHFKSSVDEQRFNCWMNQQLANLDLNTIKNEGKPVIQDIAIIAEMLSGNSNPTGEYTNYLSSATMNVKDRSDMITRLDSTITTLMNEAEIAYGVGSGINAVSLDSDYITRLGTNEFFFYTKEPLTEKEFEELQNKIATQAKTLSPGVQLILGSFAVYASNGGVMNVTPVITCGPQPDFKFIVKNHTSRIDVRYALLDNTGTIINLPPVDMKNPVVPLPTITVDGKPVDFSFDNVVNSKTPKGTQFLTAVDICLDHANGVAKSNAEKLAPKANIPISHVVVSNCINLKKNKYLGPNTIMHFDPDYSVRQGCKENVTQTQIGVLQKLSFGGYFKRFDVDKCPILSNEDVLRESLSKALSSSNGIKVTALTPFTIQLNDNKDRTDYFCLKKYLKDNGINFSSKGDSIEINDIFFHHPPPKGATTVSDMINVFYSSPGEKQQLIQDFKKDKGIQFRKVKDAMIKFRRIDLFLKDLEIKIYKINSKEELDKIKAGLIIPEPIKDKVEIKINDIFTKKEETLNKDEEALNNPNKLN